MPARKSETVYREVLHAVGKVDGKVHKWIVGVFANTRLLQNHAALLKMAYAAGDAKQIAALDPHSPATGKETPATEVKFSKSTAQYNPTPSGLDDDAALV